MAEQLAAKVSGLSLDDLSAKYPNCQPTLNPFDLYRGHLANVLHDITGVDHKIIYPNLQWTSGLDKGDIILAAPSLRVKGKKPDELAKEWVEKVRQTCHADFAAVDLLTRYVVGSSPKILFSRPLPSRTTSSASS